MDKLLGYDQKIFAGSVLGSGPQQVSVFGSLAAGGASYAVDPESAQDLSQWDDGWSAAVVAGQSPAFQDFNSFCYVATYQVAYLLQYGIAAWKAGRDYYDGSVVVYNQRVYMSTGDNNEGNTPPSDPLNWRMISTNTQIAKSITNAMSPYTATIEDNVLAVNTTAGPVVINLPTSGGASDDYEIYKISSDSNSVTVTPFGGEFINGAANDVLGVQYSMRVYKSISNGWIIKS